MTEPHIVSIQVGLPRTRGTEGAVDPLDRPWSSAFFKEPVRGRVMARRLNLDGDRQADLRVHGGVDKAVLAYSAEHYPSWRRELEIPDFPLGAFGENLSVAGLTEHDVCIGDEYEIGDARFQVSQPRQPCWKLARRWRRKDLIVRVLESGRSGWYLRVLTEGEIEEGMPLRLVSRPNPDWTVARANDVMNLQRDDAQQAAALAACPSLSDSWREELLDRAANLAGA